jgi:nitrate/nitrite transporter NarK
MAVNILFIHALGDALSPPIIGALSDHFGLFRATMIAPVMMLVSGGVLLYTVRFQAKTQRPQRPQGHEYRDPLSLRSLRSS